MEIPKFSNLRVLETWSAQNFKLLFPKFENFNLKGSDSKVIALSKIWSAQV